MSGLFIEVQTHNGRQLRAPFPSELTVGRSGSRDLPIDDPRMSRAHFKLVLNDSGQAFVTDLFSANGTHLGDDRLPPGQAVPWPLGHAIRAGGTTFTLRHEEGPPPFIETPAPGVDREPQPVIATFDADTSDEFDTLFAEVMDPDLLAALDASAESPIESALEFASVEEMVEAAEQAQQLRDVLEEGRLGKISPITAASGYLLALAAAEGITSLVDPLAGLVIYAGLLIALFFYLAVQWERPQQRYLLGLAMVPLVRLVSLTLPLHRTPEIYWYAIIGIPLAASAVLIARNLDMSRRDVGLALSGIALQFPVALSGLVTGYLYFQWFRPTPLVESLVPRDVWLPILIVFLFSGLVEEFVYRGVVQSSLAKATGASAILVVAALYALLQVGNESALLIVFAFAVALFYGWVAYRTRSIAGVAVAHGIANLLALIILPNLR
jgi:membrane protease YdiL (CAAX protease family)